MDLKCPKCKSKDLNVSKSLIKKIPLFEIIIAALLFWSIWNMIAAAVGEYRYTCTKCGKRFK